MATFDQVMGVVCGCRGVTRTALIGPARARAFVRPRMELCFLARHHTSLSYSEIGDRINRDHTSVLNGERRVRELMESSSELRAEIIEMGAQISRYGSASRCIPQGADASLIARSILARDLTTIDVTTRELHLLARFVSDADHPPQILTQKEQ